MAYKAFELDNMLVSLKPLLQRRDSIGYIAFRNYQKIENELKTYTRFKDELIRKYGCPNEEDGTYSIKPTDPGFEKFKTEYEQFANIEHSPTLMMMKYEDVIGDLSGDEMLRLAWMLEE